MSKPKILFVTSTVREGRAGLNITKLFLEEARNVTDAADFELLDIAELKLPLFDRPNPPAYGDYNDLQREIAKLVADADGFVIVTGEYNSSTPPALKNFLDYVFAEWHRKPVTFVGYGEHGGVRSIAHLVNIVSYLGAVPITGTEITSHVSRPWEAFNEDGTLKPSHVKNRVKAGLEELLWYANVLKAARSSTGSR